MVKCAAFSRLMRGAGWRTSDHVFSRFMAQEGQCTHEGMNFINFLRASEYMGQLHHVDDFNECGRLLLNSFRTARGLPGRPMSGRPPSGRQGKSKRAMTPGLHRGEAGQARHVHGSLSGGRTTPQ